MSIYRFLVAYEGPGACHYKGVYAVGSFIRLVDPPHNPHRSARLQFYRPSHQNTEHMASAFPLQNAAAALPKQCLAKFAKSKEQWRCMFFVGALLYVCICVYRVLIHGLTLPFVHKLPQSISSPTSRPPFLCSNPGTTTGRYA